MKIGSIFLTLVVIGLGTAYFMNDSKQSSNPLRAPEFSLLDAQGHEYVSTRDGAGKPLVVHFWASWGPPCTEEFPDLVELTKNPVLPNLQFILISHDSEWKDAQSLLSKNAAFGPNVHVLLDSSTRTAERFGTFQIPETYLVSAKGEIVAKWVGGQKWNTEAVRSALAQALK